jgi:hypothetical protein
MRKLVYVALLLCVSFVATSCDEDDILDIKSGLSGTVRHAQNNSRLEGATITIQGRSQISNAQGIYVFTDLDDGRHTVRVTRTGYQTIEKEIVLDDILTNVENFDMTPTP